MPAVMSDILLQKSLDLIGHIPRFKVDPPLLMSGDGMYKVHRVKNKKQRVKF